MTGPARAATLVVVVLVAVGGVAGAATAESDGAAAEDAPITIDRDGTAVTVANDSSQVVSGTADYREGTELVVRIRSTDDTQPRFIREANAVVTGNGTWAVAFDFSGQSANDTFSVTALTENGSDSVSADGEVVACSDDCADQLPEDTPTPRPEQPRESETTTGAGGDVSVAVDDAAVLVTRGSVATVGLRFDGPDAATLAVGGEGSGYGLTVTVRDEDGDGTATLFVDTALAGRAGSTASAEAPDTATVRSETSLSSALDAGEYSIDVYPGNGTEGSPATVATLIVQAPEDPTATADGAATRGSTATVDAADPLTGDAGVVLVSGAFLLGGGVLAFALLRG